MIEMAGIVEIDSHIEETFTLLFKPPIDAKIDQAALDTNGRTKEELAEFPDIVTNITALKKRFSTYINRFDPRDKFVAAGYNVNFDLGFLRETFVRAGDTYGIGSWVFNTPMDIWGDVAKAVLHLGLRLPNYKLLTVCGHYGISINAHNPMSDIEATRELHFLLEGKLDAKKIRESNYKSIPQNAKPAHQVQMS